MNNHKLSRRLLAMALSVVMALGMTPVTAAADTAGAAAGAGGEIIAFEALSEEITNQEATLGTSLEDLNLPENLTATVRIAAETDGDEPGQEPGEPAQEGPQPAPGGEGPEEENPDPGPAEITVPVPVTWTSGADYDGDTAGMYVFDAVLSEGFTLTEGTEIPRITVTVTEEAPQPGPEEEGEAERITVAAFDQLPEDVRWQNTTAPEFPETVSGTAEEEAVQIPVAWETEQDFDADYPRRGLYVFNAVLGEGYTLAEDAEPLIITVFIPETVSRFVMFRMGGSGTTDAPLEITTAAQLAEVATLVNARDNGLEMFLFNDANTKVNLKLMNDIDLSAYASGEGWMPIGKNFYYPFKGDFDGNYKLITGLYENRTAGGDCVGLFGYIRNGEIKSLGLVDVNIRGGNVTGGLAGILSGESSISNCFVTGAIQGGQALGGLVGNASGNIKNCYTQVEVISTFEVSDDVALGQAGAIAGMLQYATIENCYATGSVNGNDSNSGGIVGNISSSGYVKNSAALNREVIANTKNATDEVTANRISVKSNYAETEPFSNNIAFAGMKLLVDDAEKNISDGAVNNENGDPKSAAEIKTANFFQSLFANDTAWNYEDGKLPILKNFTTDSQSSGLPAHIMDIPAGNYFLGAGESGNPYQISTAEQLARLAELVNSDAADTRNAYNSKSYILTDNIDLSGYAEGEGWEPIGIDQFPINSEPIERSFKGTFDGNGKTVTGLCINNPYRKYDDDQGYSASGLFGSLDEGSIIKNLIIENVDITGGDYVGGVAGYVNGIVENCSVDGKISGTSSYIGGIGGRLYEEAIIRKCFSAAEVDGYDSVGGLAGFMDRGSLVQNSYSKGDVSITDAKAGGLAGVVYGTLENCYTTGMVKDKLVSTDSAVDIQQGNSWMGGIAGYARYYDASSKAVINCVALNPQILGGNLSGRIIGADNRSGSSPELANNMAFSGMKVIVNGEEQAITGGTANNKNGSDQSAADINGENFWTAVSGFSVNWNTDIWQIETGKLPILKTSGGGIMPGQDASMPLHLLGGASPFGGGDGTNADDAYEISTAAQLARLAELVNSEDAAIYNAYHDKFYRLETSLDLSTYGKSYNSGKGWIPIGKDVEHPFRGSFDGNRQVITGLYIQDSTKENTGLFGFVSGGIVKNLGIADANILGGLQVGAIAGWASEETLENCFSTGRISGGSYVGGIVGNVSSSTGPTQCVVKNCHTAGEVASNHWAGGIAGSVSGASSILENCYSTARITGKALNSSGFGGIVGTNKSVMKNCVALNESISVSGSTSLIGRVAGKNTSSEFTNNYAFSGMAVTVGGAPKNLARGLSEIDGADLSIAVANTSNFWNESTHWDDTVWTITGDKFPILTGFPAGVQPSDGGLYLTERNISGAAVLVNGDYTYTGSEITPSLTVSFDGIELEEGTDYTAAITSGNTGGASAGTGAGIVTLALTGMGNFTGTKTGVTYTIGKATLTDSDFIYTPPANLTYDGTQKAAAVSVTDGIEATVYYTGIDGMDYVESSTAPSGAGSYRVTVDVLGAANFNDVNGLELGTFTIARAPLTINAANSVVAFKTYDGTTDAEITQVAFTGAAVPLTKNVDYTVSNAWFEDPNAGGDKTVAATVTLIGGAANNYTLADGAFRKTGLSIGKATVEDINTSLAVKTNLAKDYAFDLNAFLPNLGLGRTLGNPQFSITGVVNDDGVLSPAPSTGPVSAPMTVSVASIAEEGKTVRISAQILSDNYEAFGLTITITMTHKTPVLITANMAGGVYSGSSYAYSGLTVTDSTNDQPVADLTLSAAYTGIDGTDYPSNSDAPVNVGKYRLFLSVPAGHEIYMGGKAYTFAIERRPVTVKADNKSMTKGSALPDLTYRIDGQLSGQTALIGNPVVSCASVDVNMAGTYPITVDISGISGYTDNYKAADPAFENGIMTVSDPSSSGGGSSSGKQPDAPKYEAKVGDSVKTEVTVDKKTGSAAVEIKAGQLAGEKMTVTMPVIPDVTDYKLTLPAASLSGSEAGGVVTVNTPAGSLTLPSNMLSGVSGGKAQVSIGTVKSGELPEAARAAVGNRPVVSLSLSVDGKTTAWNNPGAPVTVSIPYTPTAEELQNPEGIAVWYIDGSGNLTQVPGAKYNAATGAVVFTTTHFSYYAVGYVKALFSDVLPGAWYYDAVAFIAEKGVTTGTGGGKFSPGATLTRGQFVTMLMRAYEIAADENPADNFTDAGNTYYTGYLAAAKRLEISKGIDGDKFAPEKAITRQEMFTLLYNALKALDKLPAGDTGKTLADFTDGGSVAGWATEAMTALVKAGTVAGSDGALDPAGTTTRAQMAQVLYNLLSR